MDILIRVKLTRDQVRSVSDNFFPYLDTLTSYRVRENRENVDLYLSARAARVLFLQTVKNFERKLLTTGMRWNITMEFPHALTLYNLLLDFPISSDQFWFITLRQHITDAIHKQLMTPSPETAKHEQLPSI